MFKRLKKKLDNWVRKENQELDNFVAMKIREQWKKDNPSLFNPNQRFK